MYITTALYALSAVINRSKGYDPRWVSWCGNSIRISLGNSLVCRSVLSVSSTKLTTKVRRDLRNYRMCRDYIVVMNVSCSVLLCPQRILCTDQTEHAKTTELVHVIPFSIGCRYTPTRSQAWPVLRPAMKPGS
jgi:hypothetical protein